MNESIFYSPKTNRILKKENLNSRGCYCCMEDHDFTQEEYYELQLDTKEWDHIGTDDFDLDKETSTYHGSICLYDWCTKQKQPPYPKEVIDLYLTYM